MGDRQAVMAALMLTAIILFGGLVQILTAHDPATCPQAQAYRAYR